MKRKILIIGGTGTISSAVTHLLCARGEWEVTLLNRGKQHDFSREVNTLVGDIHSAETDKLLSGMMWDCVVDFIAFRPEHVEKDFQRFANCTKQYVFISSASCYNKPLSSPFVTESTTLQNPYWAYSREKIACEDLLHHYHRDYGFPVTIVRPSHTYGNKSVPVAIHGQRGSWQVIKRMLDGKPVIMPGDGPSLWTVTHNTDFAKAFVGLLGNVHAVGETYQVMSEEVLTWNQIHKTIADVLGVTFRPCYVPSALLALAPQYDFKGALLGDKANSVVFDLSKLHQVVPDFHTSMRFDQGVRQTLDYVMHHPECQLADEQFDKWCDQLVEIMGEAERRITSLTL